MPVAEFASRTARPATPSYEGFSAGRIELALREAIVSLKVRPGTRLSEQEIADHYRVSRQPVRQALIGLASKDLVVVLPQRGTIVTRLSTKRLMEARFVREAIETAVVRQACTDFLPASRAYLDTVLAAQAKAAARDDPSAFAQEDQEFHLTLANGIGCPLAWVGIRDLKAHMDRVTRLILRGTPWMMFLVQQHTNIVEAIDRRDPDAAVTAMSDHMAAVVQQLPSAQAEHPDLFD
jgi:GntR family transcriptional regulator, rspAB operon transcriptional repressor